MVLFRGVWMQSKVVVLIRGGAGGQSRPPEVRTKDDL